MREPQCTDHILEFYCVSNAAMIEIKRQAKYPGIITLFFNDPLGICILPRKESMDTTIVTGAACAVQVGAHLVSAGSIPGAKCTWGSYCPPCPYKRIKHDSEFPRLEQTIIISSLKCIRPQFFHFSKESHDIKNDNKRFCQSQKARRVLEITPKSFRYSGKID